MITGNFESERRSELSITRRSQAFPGLQKLCEQLFRAAVLGIAHERRYAVPSAGALYPYELDLALQTARGSEELHSLTLPALADRLAAICDQDFHGLSLTLFFRPAVSVRKYGERGIIYGMQDCGHLLANLRMAAKHIGLSCISTQFAFAAAFEGPHTAPARIAVARLDIGSEDVSGSSTGADHDGARLLGAMMARRSASAFAGPVSPPGRLCQVLETAHALWTENFAACAHLNFHLARREQVGGWRLSVAHALPDLLSAPARSVALDTVSLFCRQQFTADAGAILLCSAPIGSRAEVLHQSLALGQLGQCLYLAAEMRRCAGCCVGGFDYETAGRVIPLTAGHYVAYAMLFGLRGQAQKKMDRIPLSTPRPAIVSFSTVQSEPTDAQS